MAYFDDVKKRLKRFNPEAAGIIEMVDEACAEVGAAGAFVTIIEGMTDEEEEMAIFEAYLKEGWSPEVADVKAKEFHAKVKEAYRMLDEMPGNKRQRG